MSQSSSTARAADASGFRPGFRLGFTLIEVLAAVFLTSIVIGLAFTFFISLSRSTETAMHRTRDGRRAVALLDRVGRDLRGAYLLAKPAELDPLLHPWVFLAESQFSEDGADRLKFVMRNHRPRNQLDHGSDLAMVSYILSPSEDGPGFELLRAIEPGLPSELDRDFLPAGDPLYRVVAEGLSHFAVRFLSDTGGYQTDWDSSLIEDSSALPRAAEIEVAYLPEDSGDGKAPSLDSFDLRGEEEEEAIFLARVLLPMAAVDLASMLAKVESEVGEDGLGGEDDPTGEEGPTVSECLAQADQDELVERLGTAILDLPVAENRELLEGLGFGVNCPE